MTPRMTWLVLAARPERDQLVAAIDDRIGIRLPLTVSFDAVELWARDPCGVRSWYRVARAHLSG
jgi:hypothetical protein